MMRTLRSATAPAVVDSQTTSASLFFSTSSSFPPSPKTPPPPDNPVITSQRPCLTAGSSQQLRKRQLPPLALLAIKSRWDAPDAADDDSYDSGHQDEGWSDCDFNDDDGILSQLARNLGAVAAAADSLAHALSDSSWRPLVEAVTAPQAARHSEDRRASYLRARGRTCSGLSHDAKVSQEQDRRLDLGFESELLRYVARDLGAIVDEGLPPALQAPPAAVSDGNCTGATSTCGSGSGKSNGNSPDSGVHGGEGADSNWRVLPGSSLPCRPSKQASFSSPAAAAPAIAEELSGQDNDCTKKEEDAPCCWICLGKASDQQPLANLCRCPGRHAHEACWARWCLQQAGKMEEKQCRFCMTQLPDYRYALSQGLPKPTATAVASVHHEGKVYAVELHPGDEGRQLFVAKVRQILGLADDVELDINFECIPPGKLFANDFETPGDASSRSGAGSSSVSPGSSSSSDRLTFKGLASWDAAFFCATMAAANKATAVGAAAAAGRPAAPLPSALPPGSASSGQHQDPNVGAGSGLAVGVAGPAASGQQPAGRQAKSRFGGLLWGMKRILNAQG